MFGANWSKFFIQIRATALLPLLFVLLIYYLHIVMKIKWQCESGVSCSDGPPENYHINV